MKHAVSVSLGSPVRDHDAEIELLGERVRLTRIGTNGDLERAERLIRDLDGTVDALGLGGASFALRVGEARHPLHSMRRLAAAARRTPFVDGGTLKRRLEGRVATVLDEHLGTALSPRRVLVTVAVDRWDMAASFVAAGYACLFGDLGIGLGIPIRLSSPVTVTRLARVLMPILGRLPFAWLYPTGARQEERRPRCGRWFQWATVVAGDFLYLRRSMPARLAGKIVCTTTTTAEDVAALRAAGVRWLLTTTPVVDGRTFGANVIEAALIAASGRGRVLDDAEVADLVHRAGLVPTLRRLDA